MALTTTPTHRSRCSGLAGSDLAYSDGPNGWTYRLERDSPSEPWQIAGHGNG